MACAVSSVTLRATARARGKLEVSSIFKWFRDDFEKGHQGFRELDDVFARYATQLSNEPAVQEQLKAQS